MSFEPEKTNKLRDDTIDKTIKIEAHGNNLIKNFSIDMSCMDSTKTNDDIKCMPRPFYIHDVSEGKSYFIGKKDTKEYSLCQGITNELKNAEDSYRANLLKNAVILEFCIEDKYDKSATIRAQEASKIIRNSINAYALPIRLSVTIYDASAMHINDGTSSDPNKEKGYEIIMKAIADYKLDISFTKMKNPNSNGSQIRYPYAEFLVLQPDVSKGFTSLKISTKH